MLRVPAHPTSLVLVRRYVTDIATEARLDRRRTYRLCLAVDEILTNILMYGLNGVSVSQPIDIWHWNDHAALHVVVEDASAAYDPQPDVLDRDRIEQGCGGLGLFLARTGVDHFAYERRHGRNRHTFEVKRLPMTPTVLTTSSISARTALPSDASYSPLQPAPLLDTRLHSVH